MPGYCLIFSWLLLIMLPSIAVAQLAAPGLPDQAFDQLVDNWNQSLDNVGLELKTPALSRERTGVLLKNIDNIRQHADATGEAAAEQATVARRLLTALGPAPAAGEPGEDQATRTERQRIETEVTRYESRYKRCNLILARLDILIENIAGAERAIILRVLQERVAWSFELVPAGLAQLRARFARSWDEITRAWQEQIAAPQQQGRLLTLAGLLLLCLMAAWLLRGWLLRHYGRDRALPDPGCCRQLLACVIEFIANGLIPAALIGAIMVALQRGLLGSGSTGTLLHALLLSCLQWVLLAAAAGVVLAPHHPQWRLINLTDRAAAGIYRNFLWLLLIAVILRIFSLMLNPALSNDPRFLSEDAVFTFFASQHDAALVLGGGALLLIGFIVLRLLRPRYWRFRTTDEATGAGSESPPRLSLNILLWFARLVLSGCLLFGLAGYIGAGLLISARICWTLAALGLLWFAQHLIGTALQQATASDNRSGAWLRRRLVLDEAGTVRLTFWLQLLLNTLALVTAVILLLLIWGVPTAQLERLRDVLLGGFEIGGLLLSPITVGAALAVFVLLLIGVRLLRSFLSQQLLVQTRLDTGVRDALSTVSGYIGVFIALLAALSVLGFDFGKMALVLGGLSVGIGFGLQHIVSNFISGLILLFQRPIKAGDWVVVGDYQGHVKHIDAISTEIQTFDNASVLVPNSKLASTEVLNWTHKNTLGRVIVAVGVSYDADVEQVREILLVCAEAHPDILSRPEPRVIFQNFGDSALEFDIRFYIREIDNLMRVASEMRFAIRKAFADAGIVIPFPQHDVHLYQSQTD